MDKIKGNKTGLVSVIINCFNSESFIKEAIDSVISQTYSNWEIILWDNRSTDRTREIVKGFQDERIHYFLSQDFTSLSLARKRAIEKANGEYLAFLDSDDYWEPEKISLQVKLLKENPQIGITHTNFNLVTEDSDIKAKLQNNYYASIQQKVYSNKNIYKTLLYSNYIIFSSLLMRKNIYDATGGINESFNQNEDYELLLKASLLSQASNISAPLTYYRIHSNNQSYKNQELSYIENRVIFKNLNETFFSSLAYYRNQLRYNIFLYKNRETNLFFVLNPINWFFILEYIIRKLSK
jgi:glycosyltransferase involved in cell wall biosynthesis